MIKDERGTNKTCPICRTRPANPTNRIDARGQRWCDECQDDFDSVDWDEVNER